MKNFTVYVLLLLGFMTYSCSDSDEGSGQDNLPLEEKTLLNVSYGSHPQQVYDLYLPGGRNLVDTKVIMIIHGGAWIAGDKSDMEGTFQLLKSMYPTYAIANVNYILANENQYAFPNQFLDIQKIVQKLTAEKDELYIVPEFGMIGTSAGGHLAMMYDYQFDASNQVKFVANIVGPTDFTDPFYEENFDIPMMVQALVDPAAYPSGTNYLTELSPAFHVTANSSPTCMFFGTDDPLVPENNGTTLKQKLDQFGVSNTLRVYNGGHGDNWSTQDFNETVSIIGNYIEDYL